MQYRRFGRLDWNVSALGFGCMRLPTADGDPRSSIIDEPEAVRMIRHAVDCGVNYLDTAYPYHGGNSELVVGKALRDGYRGKVRLATKLPVWQVQAEADFDRILNEQLAKLQTDHIDFYLLHNLNRGSWNGTVPQFNLLACAEAALRDGRIGHLGFSFHDDYGIFEEIVNGYDGWEFCQIQYNYMDVENQAGAKGLKLAASKGLAVVVMEPLLGGRLANPPAAIQQVIDGFNVRRSPVDWALAWLWDQPEVTVVLSGMSTMAQIDANLRSADNARPQCMTPADLAAIDQLRQAYKQRTPIPCTKCNYCLPCPSGVNIPGNFGIYNEAFLHDDVDGARFRYGIFLTPEVRANCCTQCQTCEAKCPQGIAISEWMPKVHALLGS
jgi:uncharacterized protein